MSYMFNGASAMNGELNNWNTIKVTNMDHMFFGASSFNQPLNNWNTSSVTNMLLMFFGAPYSQDLTSWDMNKITKMAFMVNNPDSSQLPRTTHSFMTRLTYQCDTTTVIQSPISSPNGSYTWNDGTSIANNNLPKTLTGGVKYTLIYEGTFYAMESTLSSQAAAGAKCIRSLDHWGSASAAQRANNAFKGATNLTDVPDSIPSTLTLMISMFEGATSLNDSSVKTWDVSKVTHMSSMFAGAVAFNQDLSGWNTAALTSPNGTLFAPASFPNAYMPAKTSK
jgi:surface protein